MRPQVSFGRLGNLVGVIRSSPSQVTTLTIMIRPDKTLSVSVSHEVFGLIFLGVLGGLLT